MDNLVIYVISDSVGETAQQVTKAAISQFQLKDDYEIRRFPYVVEVNFLEEILKSAKEENAIVIYTLVENELLTFTEDYCSKENLSCVDLMTPILKQIASKIGVKPRREPGIIRKLDESYFKRVEAIEFAVKYDDGKDPRGILQADIILLGISRTSKTPLSMYLANKNIKVANVPLVPEIPIPKEVFEINQKKIIGLTNTPEKLNQIRQERLKALGLSSNANYAKFDRILQELDYSDKIMKKVGCPVIDVSSKAIEETAGIIMDVMKENGLKVFRDNDK
ncbi:MULTISPECIES: pyruvate, water dikinase regulatory protein [Paraclostridium]|jgi:regulator of PEP synthase PpsR (kinase-PPPase family)|uniref:Putative pyruvate, phosphate dikinase regulatory protein n=1 Tax=Paraclostridium bifermentans TaxID=1490 RepID=A0A1X2JJB4_PARBF|nr:MULTISPECIES: pyruvate, water dikinase regulatory protein [Paraclostridium]KGJ50812.1 phosphotransferase [Clostridium sp. NCR]MCU9807175.1 kinase/pyrophosphorylase [Paraclostridium sp. AKS46]MDV8110306.1 pyruvate, water dikinase regulatory protein [Bacillus sp. BAU-SS-2023]RDC50541.1 kinase/pyrophosphorylase [Acinetobacter sp. RIT592]EQK45285.1 putative phosphotransferase yqfL [[Clostridium] bifermentans ATCC 19299] [Paraclostridium bifermentans ATCC 19299]